MPVRITRFVAMSLRLASQVIRKIFCCCTDNKYNDRENGRRANIRIDYDRMKENYYDQLQVTFCDDYVVDFVKRVINDWESDRWWVLNFPLKPCCVLTDGFRHNYGGLDLVIIMRRLLWGYPELFDCFEKECYRAISRYRDGEKRRR